MFNAVMNQFMLIHLCLSMIMLLQLGTGFRVLMCITFTALMVLGKEILVSFSLLVLVHQCCLEPLLDLWLTNSENAFSLLFKSVLLVENYV